MRQCYGIPLGIKGGYGGLLFLFSFRGKNIICPLRSIRSDNRGNIHARLHNFHVLSLPRPAEIFSLVPLFSTVFAKSVTGKNFPAGAMPRARLPDREDRHRAFARVGAAIVARVSRADRRSETPSAHKLKAFSQPRWRCVEHQREARASLENQNHPPGGWF